MENSKKCTKCGKIKPLNEFYNDRRVKKDGKQAQCKECCNKQKQQYRQSHKNERNDYERKRREIDPEFKKLAAERNHKYYKKIISEGGKKMIQYKERSKKGIVSLRKRDPAYFMFSGARIRARKENLPFNLDISDIILPEYCPILGLKLEFNSGASKDNSYSLDKIIPSKGYVKGNIKVISKLANTMKQNASIELLEKFAKNIINYMKNHL